MLGVAAPAQAFMFGTDGISFEKDTEVRFNFSQTHGAFTSALKVFEVNSNSLGSAVATLFQEANGSDNGSANGFLGTASNLVGSATQSFTFLAGKVYTLGLTSTYNGNNITPVYSTSSLNRNGSQQTVFGSGGNPEAVALSNAGDFSAADPFGGPISLSFEDIIGGGDNDFNDFTVTAEAVPEPFTIGGMALGAAGLAIARRRRNKQSGEIS
ncbi:DUF4114 domain-containing protein [Oxynema aestuarii AP17]|uniref:DUF4114 domain-containing protein n=2 Tax=Oxynema TaxID=1492710 RepID=A0A6H1U3Z3_9CYAN|nr:DUF4114 domain-containing protein [Oxynema aestuarii AP17]RMH74883.1 MAG: DUF4114 domain-containing protein [Cyanobacteria bacterium J007]